jgi:hypothetical protein
MFTRLASNAAAGRDCNAESNASTCPGSVPDKHTRVFEGRWFEHTGIHAT